MATSMIRTPARRRGEWLAAAMGWFDRGWIQRTLLTNSAMMEMMTKRTACLGDCRLASCGDGHLHEGVETCDDGGEGGCLEDCSGASLGNAVQITTGSRSTCRLLRNETLECWGLNRQGQLADGTTENRGSPTPVRSLTRITKVAFADGKACALRATNELYCWGNNINGGLGDGTTQSRSTPGLVLRLNRVIDFDIGRVGALKTIGVCIAGVKTMVVKWGWHPYQSSAPGAGSRGRGDPYGADRGVHELRAAR